MAFPHRPQKQLRHLCNYFGDTLCDHGSDTISMHCTVNLKVMFVTYSNGNESICFESTGWEYENRWNMVDSSGNIILYMPNLLMQPHIMSSLSCSRSERQILQHNIKDSSPIKRMPRSPTDWQTHTYSQQLNASLRLYSILRLHLKVCKHANMITSHSICLSLPALLTSDEDDIYLSLVQLPAYI